MHGKRLKTAISTLFYSNKHRSTFPSLLTPLLASYRSSAVSQEIFRGYGFSDELSRETERNLHTRIWVTERAMPQSGKKEVQGDMENRGQLYRIIQPTLTSSVGEVTEVTTINFFVTFICISFSLRAFAWTWMIRFFNVESDTSEIGEKSTL